ncbi:lipase 3-like [Schistocerca serialis cubense]|uniref:lipase 3-like n=1 Tax=Schistocerca serialis cubense TaxID=2023355 RepID=UPI00214E6104|nr:lipase 3-like [Schistocerca serialis cubense]
MVAVQRKGSLLPLLALLVLVTAEDGPNNVNSDAYLDTPGLIEKYGYPVEQHQVVSQSGYILTLFRIPRGKNCSVPGEPVLMHHGFLADSDSWLLQEDQSLPYVLVDSNECYDVWLANGRGNRYSRNHTTLDPDKSEYWQFSWHEQGAYDIPAIIDYILSVAGKSALMYLGHSMGTTIYFVMACERPEYQQKVQLAFLLAPVCYMSNIPSPIIRFISPFANPLAHLLGPLLHWEIPPSQPPTPESVETHDNSTVVQVLEILGAVLGTTNIKEVNISRYEAQHSRGISGGSVRQAVHYAQEVVSGHFRQYDFGLLRNIKKYGSTSPPDYNLRNIFSPVIAMYGNGDWLVGEKDVKRLANDTPPNVQFYRVPEDGFAHSDFLIGKNAPTLVYPVVLAAFAGEDIGASKDVDVDTDSTSRTSMRLSAPTQRSRPEGRKKKKTQTAKKTVPKVGSSLRRRSGRHQRL